MPILWKNSMRTKGAFEYKEDHEELLCEIIGKNPKTTNLITKEFRKIFSKIDHKTVNRLLENLYKNSKIKKFQSGRINLWLK